MINPLLKFLYMDVGFLLRGYFWKTVLQIDRGRVGKNFKCYAGVVFMQTSPGAIRIGDHFRILRNSTVNTHDQGRIEIGNHVYIGETTSITACRSVRLGNFVTIGPQNIITDLTHDTACRDLPIRSQPLIGKPVVIEDDVWISSHCVILPGVTIGRGAVIGAGAVVTKDVPPYAVAAGVPAKVIKWRGGIRSPALQ